MTDWITIVLLLIIIILIIILYFKKQVTQESEQISKLEELEREFRKRVQLIYNIYQKKIMDYDKVQEIVTKYYKHPDEVMAEFGVV